MSSTALSPLRPDEVVDGEAAGAGQAEAPGDGAGQERNLVATLPIEAVFPVRLVGGDGHVEGDGDGGRPGEKARHEREPAGEFGYPGGRGGGVRGWDAHLLECGRKAGPAPLDGRRIIGSHHSRKEFRRSLSRPTEQLRVAVRREGKAGDDPEQQQAKVTHQWRLGQSVAETKLVMRLSYRRSLVAIAVLALVLHSLVRAWRRWDLSRAASA